MILTIDRSLLDLLLLAASLWSWSYLAVSAWTGNALLVTGLLRSGSNTAAGVAVNFAASLFDFLEAVAVRDPHAVG